MQRLNNILQNDGFITKITKRMPNKLDFPTKQQIKNSNPIHLAIYVPSTKNFTEPISSAEFKKRINGTKKFLNSLGGTTTIRGVGSYNLKGKIISEKVAIVESFAKEKDYNKLDLKLKTFINRKKREWGQDSIGYEFEENLIFI